VDWTVQGDAQKITARYPVIVVMPEAGGNGNSSNWYNWGAGGPPRWETFHIRQLVPWIDYNLRTIARREGRGLAGLSMGGGGAMRYASRHPDMFVSAASFSGAVDTNYVFVQPLVDLSPTFSGEPQKTIYGPRATEEVRWRGDNPWDLATNLREMVLALYVGNGQPKPGQCCAPFDPVEYGTYEMSLALHHKLQELGIDHRWVEGLGQHQWGDWQSYLRSWLPTMMRGFARPPSTPTRVTFTSIASRYNIFGWTVSVDRPAAEFSTLVAGARSFSLSGSGSARVITPPRYSSGTVHDVWISRESSGCRHVPSKADGRGRLSVGVPLGPGNPDQQYTVGARQRGTQVRTTYVFIGEPGWACTQFD
jgi:S-formylglutathione hydrolase FrmB